LTNKKCPEFKLVQIHNQIKHDKMYLLHYIMISAELLNFGKNYFYTVIDNK